MPKTYYFIDYLTKDQQEGNTLDDRRIDGETSFCLEAEQANGLIFE